MKFCLDCRAELKNAKAKRCQSCAGKHRFSIQEARKAQSEKLSKFWTSLRNSKEFGKLGRRTQKQLVIEEQQGKCLHCGVEQKWNGLLLVFQLDHIDGNRSNSCRENLRALCPNCHSQTPTYGSRSASLGSRIKIAEGAKRGAASTLEKRLKSKLAKADDSFYHSL